MKTLTVNTSGGAAEVFSAAVPNDYTYWGPYPYATAQGPDRFSFSVVAPSAYAFNYLTWVEDSQTWYSTNSYLTYCLDGSYTAHIVNKIRLNIQTIGQGVVTSPNFAYAWNPRPYQSVAQGTSLTPLVNANLVSMTPEPCPGWGFDYWQYKNAQGQWVSDHRTNLPVYMNWWSGDGIRVPNGVSVFDVKAVFIGGCDPDVKILDADITQDNIRIMLTPINGPQTGQLVLELFGPNNAYYLIRTVNRDTGIHNETFNIPQMPEMPDGEFTTVRATWTVNQHEYQDEFSVHFQNLGLYRHSQYNTPHESHETCQGGQLLQDICLGDHASASGPPCPGLCCDTMWSLFASQARMNGNGISQCAGEVMRSTICDNWGVICPELCPDRDPNSLEAVAAIETGCRNTDLGDDTVAIRQSGHPYLSCGSRVFVFGQTPQGQLAGTIKRVTDTGLLQERQCDNYNPSNHSCTGWLDLGDFVTILLLENQ